MSMSGVTKKGGPVSEINVTPLVDIMLVLLIIMSHARCCRRAFRSNCRWRTTRRQAGYPAADRRARDREQGVLRQHAGQPRDLVDRIKRALEEKKEKVVY